MNYKFTKSDFYLALVYYAFAIPVSMLDFQEYPEKWKLFVEVGAFSIITGISMYVFVFVLFARFFPKRQYATLFIFTLIYFFFMGAIEMQIQCGLNNCKGDPWSWLYIYYGFSSHINDVGLFSALMIGKKLYDAQLYYANLEKEKKASELRFLKAQIDPHFLFNNLNTIDALIDKNPNAAKNYLNKLAQLYRYLISSKDFEVVPLEEELEFARNYMFLLESRYGKAYQFEIVNENQEEGQLIPPGSLQTLLENIVKHNQASEEKPIHSSIKIGKDGINVSNDLRAKKITVDSTGIGLENLKARYELLTDKAIKVHSNGKFLVELPLIKEVD